MKIKPIIRSFVLISTLSSALLISACAGSPSSDPYEKFNRKVFKFNNVIDKVAYRPVAKVYETIIPQFVRRGLHNVFGNVNQVPITINDVLQLNIPLAMQDLGRLGINTTLGLGGWFDVAKHMGAPRHDQDFGITLARWGWKDSNYLLLPFFPVGTPRDLIGLYVDYTYLLPWAYVKPTWIPYTAYALIFIDKRASFLPADKLIEESFDPYIFVRDAYLQNRRKQIAAMRQPYGQDETLPSLDQDAAKIAQEVGSTPEAAASPSHAEVVALSQPKGEATGKKASKIQESADSPATSGKKTDGTSEHEDEQKATKSIKMFSPKNIAGVGPRDTVAANS